MLNWRENLPETVDAFERLLKAGRTILLMVKNNPWEQVVFSTLQIGPRLKFKFHASGRISVINFTADEAKMFEDAGFSLLVSQKPENLPRECATATTQTIIKESTKDKIRRLYDANLNWTTHPRTVAKKIAEIEFCSDNMERMITAVLLEGKEKEIQVLRNKYILRSYGRVDFLGEEKDWEEAASRGFYIL